MQDPSNPFRKASVGGTYINLPNSDNLNETNSSSVNERYMQPVVFASTAQEKTGNNNANRTTNRYNYNQEQPPIIMDNGGQYTAHNPNRNEYDAQNESREVGNREYFGGEAASNEETNEINNTVNTSDNNNLIRQKQWQQQSQRASSNASQQPVKRKQDLYFQTKIRNSGFWGKVKLRFGTYLIMFGFLQFCASIVMIGVFWRWWWGPTTNIINRIIAITLLCTSITCVVAGGISNYMMKTNSFNKNVLGSPLRKSSWLLIASIISLFCASILMSIYYLYWHNRYVNTPIISVSIVCYFFGTIGVLLGFRLTYKEYILIRFKARLEQQKLKDEKKAGSGRLENQEADEDDNNLFEYRLENNSLNLNNTELNADAEQQLINEMESTKQRKFEQQQQQQMQLQMMQQQTAKRDFRKKNLHQIKARQ